MDGSILQSRFSDAFYNRGMKMSEILSHDDVRAAISGSAAAFRCRQVLQPAGGEGSPVFPPTYSGGEYATEERRIPGRDEPVPCVLLNSVQSEANHVELALLEAWENGEIPLPVISVDFAGQELLRDLRVTSLEAPHRIADALLRDSLLDGVLFRESSRGRALDVVDLRNATALFELCPTALVFGLWDSTGPRGGLGAKFARAYVSEVVGIDAVPGKKTASRIDPAQIRLGAGPVYERAGGGWTLDEAEAAKEKGKPIKAGKDGKPSEVNHGNVTPSIGDGGFTIAYALRTSTLSLPALRRLRFPINGERDAARDRAAQTALAALALCGATLAQASGGDLRSRCHLVPAEAARWELIDEPGAEPKSYVLNHDDAIALYRAAVDAAKAADLPWLDEPLSR
ncbi:MAG TPA: type I-U CRISPR-associated RAMP protein Csb1/Cas7u, partial [Dokdonella sp.]